MKFSVTKEKLLECLQQVQNVVSTRTTLPILSNVLLQTNGSEVRLTTTDLDVGVRGSFEAEDRKRRRHHSAGAPPLHHHSRAALERNSVRRRWQKRRLDPQRTKLFQDPRPARGRISAACRNSTIPKSSPSGRRICATVCARPPTPSQPTRRATSSTACSSASRITSSPSSRPMGAGSRCSTSIWNFRAATRPTSSCRPRRSRNCSAC